MQDFFSANVGIRATTNGGVRELQFLTTLARPTDTLFRIFAVSNINKRP